MELYVNSVLYGEIETMENYTTRIAYFKVKEYNRKDPTVTQIIKVENIKTYNINEIRNQIEITTEF